MYQDIEQNSRFVIPPETGINRMDVKAQNFQMNSKCLQNASSRHVRMRPKSPSSKVFLLDSGSTSCGNGRILSKLEQRSPLHVFPPFGLIHKCLRKIIKDKATVLLIAPVWQSRPWYLMLLNLLYDRPLLLPHNPQILKLPWSQTVHPLFQNRKFRLAV